MPLKRLVDLEKLPLSDRRFYLRAPGKGDKEKCARIIEEWNKLATECGFPHIQKVNDKRIAHLLGRLAYYRTAQEWRVLFHKIRNTQVLRNRSFCSWFDFDWLVTSDSHLDKVMNGWMDCWNTPKDEKQPSSPATEADLLAAKPLLALDNGWTFERILPAVQYIRAWLKKQTNLYMNSQEFFRQYANHIKAVHGWKTTISPKQLGKDGEIWKTFLKDLKKRGVSINGH